MSSRIFGRRSRRRRPFFVGSLLVLAISGLIAVAVAQAVHDDNLFELGPAQGADILGDGNAANGPDWADLFDASGNSTGNLFGGLAATFLKDETSQKGASDRTTFSGAGGSNKNNDPISTADCAAHTPPLTGSACDTWHWDSGNVPAKDDLVNSYVYATMPATGDLADHLILYAGLERLDESGDSHVDFEFLQNPLNIVDGAVSGEGAIPCNDPGSDPIPCEFSGIRQVDDVIVSMDFVQGGGIGSVEVRRWNGNEYVLEGVEGGEGCNVADSICAFNNGATINGGPWPNFDKTGNTVTSLLANAFTEIGVDVTELLGETPCISTVTNKTRSSSSFTAELKDFSAPRSFPICGGKISIAPDDVNAVGEPHTFTVHVAKTIGGAEEPAPDGTIVDVTLTDANGAVNEISSNTCADPGTVGGTCSITFTSDSPGTVTGHAEADFDADGIPIHVETDGAGQNSGDAVKRFVDAKISITPDDTNSIGESHTFTVNVQQDDGLPANAVGGDAATGFGPAPNGTTPSVTLTDSNGAISTGVVDTCGGVGTVSGSCSVTFTSNTAGTVTGHASVTLSVGGVSLIRATDGTGNNSDDGVKVFVSGSIAWTKNDNAGQLQGGATFRVCRTHTLNTETGVFADTADVCFDVTDNSAPDTDAADGKFKVTGLVLGRYTVTETVAPPGFEPDPVTRTVEITLANPDATIQTAFVNQRPILKITGFGYTNEASGSPTAGVRSGTATYTVNLHNYGGAAAVLSNSSLVITRTGIDGTVTCGANSDPVPFTRTITGTVAAGANLIPPVTLICNYTNVGDGTQIIAALNVNYTTNGLERAASGSPAMVSFTVQGD
jgi:hypothetical protein